ncbi:MAG: SDR family oxidoreductase [Bradymonadaceae bacterium]
MKVLITGISSKLGRILARRLVESGQEVLGIDRRPWPDAPRGVEMFNTDIRKRPAEDVFRTRRPDAVVHMATVTHFSASADERHRINLGGTRAIFDHCHTYGVKQAIFVGRHTFYGAAPDSPLYHTEAEPPMAVNTFPELADLVAADLFAASALWRYPEIDTAVMRLCYVLGPSQQGTLASYLKGPRVPTVLGFDPLFQFIHEQDAIEAICLGLEARLRGVFNVVGPQPVPLALLIRETGRRHLPLPQPVLARLLGRFDLPNLPAGAINHIKYSIVVDGSAFAEVTGFTHRFDEIQTMEAFRWA